MKKKNPFTKNAKDYDLWFERHEDMFQKELIAIKPILPLFKNGIEIGVGTGRFALPLGVKIGIEPTTEMASIAEERGISIIKGVAENLPLADNSFDLVLFVTTICFVDDALQSLKEAHRILENHGHIVIGFVDKLSPLGKTYLKKKNRSKFYQPAIFFSEEELLALLNEAGFFVANTKRISLSESTAKQVGDFTVICATPIN